MRIIAGEFRSRKLQSPPEKSETRPIPDRVKESLFSILRGHFEDARVLDAFAGTGSMGLEAVSRGAAHCTFIERDRAVAKVLEANIATLGCADRCEVVTGDALAASSLARVHEKVHVAFFDPPYAVVENDLGWRRTRDQLVRTLSLLDEGGYLVHRTPWPFTHAPDAPIAVQADEEGDERESRRKRKDKGAHRRERKSEMKRLTGPYTPEEEASEEDVDVPERAPAPPLEIPPAELSLDLADPSAEAALEAFEEQLSQIMGAPTRLDVDLSIPGAVGPETHVYGTTALHFYQAIR